MAAVLALRGRDCHSDAHGERTRWHSQRSEHGLAMVCLLPGLVTPKPANVGDSELYMWPMGHIQFERLCISAWQLGYRVAALVSAALGVDWATLPTTMLNTNATAHHEHQS